MHRHHTHRDTHIQYVRKLSVSFLSLALETELNTCALKIPVSLVNCQCYTHRQDIELVKCIQFTV